MRVIGSLAPMMCVYPYMQPISALFDAEFICSGALFRGVKSIIFNLKAH